jgi:hypothetical protein
VNDLLTYGLWLGHSTGPNDDDEPVTVFEWRREGWHDMSADWQPVSLLDLCNLRAKLDVLIVEEARRCGMECPPTAPDNSHEHGTMNPGQTDESDPSGSQGGTT